MSYREGSRCFRGEHDGVSGEPVQRPSAEHSQNVGNIMVDWTFGADFVSTVRCGLGFRERGQTLANCEKQAEDPSRKGTQQYQRQEDRGRLLCVWHSAECFMCTTLFKTYRNCYCPHFTYRGGRAIEGKLQVTQTVSGSAEI